MKMANMDALFDGLFSMAAPPDVSKLNSHIFDDFLSQVITLDFSLKEILHFADICAGPGGFSEYLTWRRGHPFGEGKIFQHRFPRIRGYGMTLAGPCDFKMSKFLAGPAEAFYPFYGANGDGDITKWSNLSAFSRFIIDNTGGKGVHVVMADGVSVSDDGFPLDFAFYFSNVLFTFFRVLTSQIRTIYRRLNQNTSTSVSVYVL